MNWIQTAGGQVFDLENPTADMINLEEIALALSRIPRFGGHTAPLEDWGYSVAQHCYLASLVAPKAFRPAALLHDASEAYTGDITKPLKRCLGSRLEEIEAKIQGVINVRFGLVWNAHQSPEVHAVDLAMLAAERRSLMAAPPIPWADDTAPAHLPARWFEPLRPRAAMYRFLDRARELGIK